MSLTSELRTKGSFARTFVDREFPHLRSTSVEVNKTLLRFNAMQHPTYPDLYTYSLVGTAVDYRIRSFFTKSPHLGGAIQLGLRGFESLLELQTSEGRIENQFCWLSGRESLVSEFNESVVELFSGRDFVRHPPEPSQEETLCRYCVLLARIDFFGRRNGSFFFLDAMKSGVFDIEGFIADVDRAWVDDIAACAAAFSKNSPNLFGEFARVFHGCSLIGSADVGGADFDLVVDGCLTEIKTIVRPKITTDSLRQLVGYWLLDYDDELAIRSASIYLTRQGYEQRWEIADLLRANRSAIDLRAAFRDGLRANVTGSPAGGAG